ncbi:MAG: hypothetical protein ACOCX2_00465 [Armatimonadota bacterium]
MARRVSRKPKRKLSTAAWFGIGCGGVLVLGLIVAIVLWFMASGEPPLPPEAQATASTESGGASQAAPSGPPLEQQMEYVEQAERSQQPVPVTMTIRESELNEMLARENTSEVRDLKVYFGDGTIAATGQTEYRGQSVHLTIRATPVVSGGRLSLDVHEVMVGRLQAPEAIKQQVREEIDRALERSMRNRDVQIGSVQVAPDVLTVSGRVGGG